MRLWRRKRGSDQPPLEAMSDKQRLEQLLDRLADIIGDGDDTDRFWSGKVHACADQVRAGQVRGLRNFLGLFGGMGSINDQGFSQVRELSEAYGLASGLLRQIEYEASSHSDPREIVLRPWKAGSTGKAVVYEDGTVVATEDDAGGDPHLPDIRTASRPDEDPVAELAIRTNGLCAIYRHKCDHEWLAARVREHDPGLRLEQTPPRG
jgi:hypothetical protein